MRMVVLMALTALLLSGCFRYQSTLVVHEDGSGQAQELLVVDRRVVESMFDTDSDIEAHLPRAADFDLPDWVIATDYADGTYEGVVMDIVFDEPEQLNDRLNSLHDLLAVTVGSVASTDVRVERLRDGWDFTMRTADLAQVPTLPGTRPDAGVAELYRGAQLVFALQLPGRVVDHNADSLVDGQLVWRISAQSVQTQMYARTTTSDALASSPRTNGRLQIATAVATLGGIAVFTAVAITRRRQLDHAGGAAALAHLGDARPIDPGPPAAWPATPPTSPPTERPPPHAGPPRPS